MRDRLVFLCKVSSKGTIFIPKAAREYVGISEKSVVILEVDKEKIIIKPLRVTRVKIDKETRLKIEKILSEEYILEEEKAERLVKR